MKLYKKASLFLFLILFSNHIFAFDWASIFNKSHTGGYAKVIRVEGSAFVNKKAVQKNDKIKNLQVIRVSENSNVILETVDKSIIKIKGEASLKLELDRTSGGVLDLLKGAILVVTSKLKSKNYIVKGPTATIGIKGTVFFRKIFSHDKLPKHKKISSNTKDYFCVCNGEVDYLAPNSARKITSRSGTHHNPVVLSTSKSSLKVTPIHLMVDHTDQEINELIQLMGRKSKHDDSWLKL